MMLKVLGLFVALVVIVAGVVTIINNGIHSGLSSAVEREQTQGAEQVLIKDGVYFEKMSLSGMTRAEVKSAIEKWISDLDWNMRLQCRENMIPVEKYLSCPDELLEDIFAQGSIFKSEPLSTGENAEKSKLVFTADRLFDEQKANEILTALAEEYDTLPQDAALTGLDENDNLVFTDSRPGHELNKEATLAILHDTVAKRNFHNNLGAVYDLVEPTYTLEQAQADYGLIGSFYTLVGSYNPARDTNIRVACNTVNGTIVKPGEEFSILGILGETTVEKGYQAAATYANGKVVDDLGGGICQVSTTLYNAVVKSGLQTTERHYHSMAVHYVELGEDAMISYPNSDLRFVNNSDGNVLVQMYYYSSEVHANIYGKPVLGDGITVKMYSETTEEMPAVAQYIEDPSLEYGTQERESGGDDGARVTTYLVTYQYGTEISREWLHNSVYQPRNPVYRRNTSTPPPTVADTTPASEPTSTSQSQEDPDVSSSGNEDGDSGNQDDDSGNEDGDEGEE